MKNTLEIATLFLAFFGFGSSLVMAFFPLHSAGKSFVRYYLSQNCVFQGLFFFCLWRLGQLDANLLWIAGLSVWTWTVSFFSVQISRIELFLIRALAVVSCIFLILFPQIFIGSSHSVWLGILPRLTFLCSAFFLSYFLMNMIFGHWYLTNRKLDISHLIRTSRWLVVMTYVRIASVGLAVIIMAQRLESTALARLIDFMGHGVFFWARILAGLLIPAVVAHLSYAAAKIKSNQSATGILYAGCVFVIMGELIALYLYALTGVAF